MAVTTNGTAMLVSLGEISPIRFNARTRNFSKATDKVRLKFGVKESTIATIQLGHQATQADQLTRDYIDSIRRAVVDGATTTVTENIWGSLPTYASYVDLEEVYDVDEIKELYLQAAKKRGW